MSGPSRKPEGERKRRSRPAPVTVLPGGKPAPPPPPAGLLAVTRDAWIGFWQSPLAQYASARMDLMTLTRLFRMYDEQERAYRALTKPGAKRIVDGSKGQPRLSPLYGLIDRLEAKINHLEDRFGMSPRARQNLGIKPDADGPTLDDLNRGLAEGDADAGGGPEDPRRAALAAARRSP